MKLSDVKKERLRYKIGTTIRILPRHIRSECDRLNVERIDLYNDGNKEESFALYHKIKQMKKDFLKAFEKDIKKHIKAGNLVSLKEMFFDETAIKQTPRKMVWFSKQGRHLVLEDYGTIHAKLPFWDFPDFQEQFARSKHVLDWWVKEWVEEMGLDKQPLEVDCNWTPTGWDYTGQVFIGVEDFGDALRAVHHGWKVSSNVIAQHIDFFAPADDCIKKTTVMHYNDSYGISLEDFLELRGRHRNNYDIRDFS